LYGKPFRIAAAEASQKAKQKGEKNVDKKTVI